MFVHGWVRFLDSISIDTTTGEAAFRTEAEAGLCLDEPAAPALSFEDLEAAATACDSVLSLQPCLDIRIDRDCGIVANVSYERTLEYCLFEWANFDIDLTTGELTCEPRHEEYCC